MSEIKFDDVDIFPSSQTLSDADVVLLGTGTGGSRIDFQLQLSELYKYISRRVHQDKYAVGEICMLADGKHPFTDHGYGSAESDWELLPDDCAVYLAGTSRQASINAEGENTPAVPLPQHSHGATFKGNALPNHEHGTDTPSNTALNNRGGRSSGGATGSSGSQIANTKPVSAGTPSGSVTINNAGTPNATLNVRGQHIYLKGWRRIK